MARASRGETRKATPLRRLLRDVLPIPTASYEEQRVLAYLERFAADPRSTEVRTQQTRLWFYPDNVDVTLSNGPNA